LIQLLTGLIPLLIGSYRIDAVIFKHSYMPGVSFVLPHFKITIILCHIYFNELIKVGKPRIKTVM